MAYYIGVDLGGTNIAVGLIDENCNLLKKESVKTALPRSDQEIYRDIALLCEKLVKDTGITLSDVEWIGIGSPGTANRNTGILEYSCNLAFENSDMQGSLQNHLNRPVYIENDANAAALGEFLAGSGRGKHSMVAITLGTGIGGGVIIDGKIFAGFNFAGAELGHTVIVKDGRPCTCGRNGCFETYASATGLIRSTAEAMEHDKDSLMWKLLEDRGNISARTAFDAMRAGDRTAKQVVDEYISYLGCGLVDMINIFQPEVLCIGGGICGEGEVLLAPLRKVIEKERYSRFSSKQTKLVTASLGNDAGIIGAAMLGRSI